MTPLGRVQVIRNGAVDVASDLANSLAYGDAAYAAFLDMIDAHIARQALAIPEEAGARAVRPDPRCVVEPLRRFDLRAVGISSVIWATGYRCDFGWIDIPVLDARGEPVHRGQVTEVPGLYFLGLPWLSKMTSSSLAGVGDDAARLARRVAARCSLPGFAAAGRVSDARARTAGPAHSVSVIANR